MEELIESISDVPSSVEQKLNAFRLEKDDYRARKLEISLEIKKAVAIKSKLNPKWKKIFSMGVATVKSVLTLGLAGKYADENMITIAEIMNVKGD